jgi:hypothetical protein
MRLVFKDTARKKNSAIHQTIVRLPRLQKLTQCRAEEIFKGFRQDRKSDTMIVDGARFILKGDEARKESFQ